MSVLRRCVRRSLASAWTVVGDDKSRPVRDASNVPRGIRPDLTRVHRVAGAPGGWRPPGSRHTAHQSTAMRLEPIPDHQQLSVAQMPPQRLEEGDDLRRPHRALHQLEVDVPEADTSDR